MTTIAQQVSSLRYPGYRYDSVQDNAANGLSIDYALNNVGNVVGLDERQVSGATVARTVDYDGLDRLMALKDGASTAQGFTYDDYGRMRQFLNGSTLRNQYRYNGRGERIARINVTSPGSTLYYVYDEAGRLPGEYNSSGVTQKEYLWLDDTLVAILGSYQGHKLQYVLTDHLGYGLPDNNCQDFADSLRAEYARLGGPTCPVNFVKGKCPLPGF